MFKTTARLAAVTFTAGALALAGAASAGAATTATPNATAGCSGVFPQCRTPVVALSTTSSTDLVPAADFAMRYAGKSPGTGVAYGDVRTNFQNTLQDGTEDWTWVNIGSVPSTGAGPFRFTGFDRTNFPLKPVDELEYTPFGQDTQLCLTISSKYRPNGAVLGNCISAAQQSFIVTQTAPFLAPLTPNVATSPGNTKLYSYAFDVSQAANAQHHLALLAPHGHINGELIAAGNPVHVAAGKASLNMWSSIP
jgi:hypothetical protein